jgi:hypothetical protein
LSPRNFDVRRNLEEERNKLINNEIVSSGLPIAISEPLLHKVVVNLNNPGR